MSASVVLSVVLMLLVAVNPYLTALAQQSTANGNTTDPIVSGAFAFDLAGASGGADIGSDGSVAYSIKIEVPPGPGGLHPALSLNYSSGSRTDTWVGFGWSLSVGAITLATRQGTPTYSGSDGYELDGEPLIETEPGSAEFRTRFESHNRIRKVSWDSASGSWSPDPAGTSWEVTSPDGTSSIYGLTDSEVLRRSDGAVFGWLLSRVTDLRGNVMEFEYFDVTKGEVSLKTACYGLRRAEVEALNGPPCSVQGDRQVTFALEVAVRPDPSVIHTNGFPQERTRRLDYVDVRAAGDLIRRYDLEYGELSHDSGRSVLREIRQYGADAEGATPMPPLVTKFSYGSNVDDGRTGWELSTDWTLPSEVAFTWQFTNPDLGFILPVQKDGGTRIADMNGDGLPDLLRHVVESPLEPNPLGWPSLLFTNGGQGGFISSTPSLPLLDGVPVGTAYAGGGQATANIQSKGVSILDLDGDGRSDVVLSNFSSNLWTSTSRFHYFRNGVSGWSSSAASLDYLSPGSSGDPGMSVHRMDNFVGYCEPHPENPMVPLCFFNSWTGADRFADVNADGRLDLVRRFGNVSTVSSSWTSTVSTMNKSGDGFSSVTTDAAAYCNIAPMQCDETVPTHHSGVAYSVSYSGTRIVDFNSDGLSDELAANGRTLHVGVGFGALLRNDGWALPAELSVLSANGYNQDLGVRFADVNGDGRTDVLSSRQGTPNGTWINSGLADAEVPGSAWTQSSDWQLPASIAFVSDVPGYYWSSGQDLGYRLTDLDGDGMVDIIRGDATDRSVYLNRGRVPDLLEQVESPLGATWSYEYSPSTSFDNPELAQIRQIVSKVSIDDARGGISEFTYEYAGGRWDPDERIFLGFAEVKKSSSLGDTETTRYYQSAQLVGLKSSREIRSAQGELYDVETFGYEPDEEPPFRRLRTLHRTERYDGDETATPLIITAEWEYDEFGNETREIRRGSTLRPATPDRVKDTVYTAPNLSSYLVDRPARITAHHPTDPSLSTVTEIYYDGEETDPEASPTLGLPTKRIGYLNGGQSNLIDRFGYDEFGNQTSYIDPWQRQGSTQYDTTFHTYPTIVTNPLFPASETSYVSSASCPSSYPAGAGRPQVISDANGHSSIRCYDSFGRLEVDIGPAGLTETRYLYDDTPGSVSVTKREILDGGNYRDTIAFVDGVGRTWKTSVEGPSGIRRESESFFDAKGRTVRTIRPRYPDEPVLDDIWAYDALDRKTSHTMPGNRVSTFGYERGHETETDPNNNILVNERDEFGELRAVHEYPDGPLGAAITTKYEYDHAGRLARLIPSAPGPGEPTVHDTLMSYDALGRPTVVDDPDRGLTRTFYGPPVGYPTKPAHRYEYTLDANGIQVTTEFDPLDRPVSVDTTGSVPIHVTYEYDTGGAAENALGRLRVVEDDVGHHTFTYDPLGRILDEVHELDGNTFAFNQSYDRLSQPRVVTYPTGSAGPSTMQIEIMYDSKGYPSSVLDLSSGVTLARGMEWDGRERLVHLTSGDGVSMLERYSTQTDLLQEISLQRGSMVLDRTHYEFDPGARVSAIRNELNPQYDRTYPGYDGLNRLTQASGPYGLEMAAETLDFDYDRYGNLTLKDGIGRQYGRTDLTGLPIEARGVPHAPTSAGSAQLSYDAVGNLLEFGQRRFGWDSLSRLNLVKPAGDGEVGTLSAIDAGARVELDEPVDLASVPIADLELAVDLLSIRGGTAKIAVYYYGDGQGKSNYIGSELLTQLTRATTGPIHLQGSAWTPPPGATRAGFAITLLGDSPSASFAHFSLNRLSSPATPLLTSDWSLWSKEEGGGQDTWIHEPHVATFQYDYTGRRVRSTGPAGTRYFVTPGFEWDGTEATIHVFLGDRRLASRTFPFSPEIASAVVPALPKLDGTLASPREIVVGVLFGPPLVLLLGLLWDPRRRRIAMPTALRVAAGLSLSWFWIALVSPPARAGSDRDADGLGDSAEIFIYQTDPDLADTDGDSHRDGAEIAAGSDPLSPTSHPIFRPTTEFVAYGSVPAAPDSTAFASVSEPSDSTLGPSGATIGRLGFESVRRALGADQDGDGIVAILDHDDSDPNQTGSRYRDLDRDGIPDEIDDDADGDGILDAVDSDRDNDWLSDIEEALLGTDPLLPDTDGDGLTDGLEVSLGRSDPLLADTDGDGIPDADDQSPSDPTSSTWIESVSIGDLNGDERLDSADGMLILSMVRDELIPSWIQLRQADVAPLASGGDDILNIADVMLILQALGEGDTDGDGVSNSIEVSAGTSPFAADTDGDGLTDLEELYPESGDPTDPLKIDTDGDGLSDAFERDFGSNSMNGSGLALDPNSVDSDGDGISDGDDADPTMAGWTYYHTDHLQSTTLVTNSRGEPVSRVIYKPYGESVVTAGTTPEFGFTGQRLEADLAIYDYGARFYDPALGRFLSADTIVPEPADPQSFNRYSYVRNNPVNRVDPSGGIDEEKSAENDTKPKEAVVLENKSEDSGSAGGDGNGDSGAGNADAVGGEVTGETVRRALDYQRRSNAELSDTFRSQSGPMYKPAPPGLIGTRDYYIWRNANAPDSFKLGDGDNYYIDYGLRKFDEFQALREGASPRLQRFIDRASIELQLGLEAALEANPAIELNRSTLFDAAIDTHDAGYRAAGFKGLSPQDKFSVGWTGGRDIFVRGGLREVWQSRDLILP